MDGFLTEYAEKKFNQLSKIASEDSVLDVEFCDALGTKGNGCEIKVNFSHPGQKEAIYISVMTPHFQSSIDQVKDKLDLKLRKTKEKLLDRKSSAKEIEEDL